MLNRGKLSVLAAAGLVVVLLACKKGGDTAATATATPPPAPTPAPEPPKEAEPTASASAEPAKPDEPAKGPTVVTTKTPTDAGAQPKDAGTTKDAGSADAAVDAGKPASNPAADAKAIEACCGALATEAKKPGPHSNKYKSAAAVCSGIAASVKKGAADAASARTTIRAQLQGVPVPGGC